MGTTSYYPELKVSGLDPSLQLLYVHMDTFDIIGAEEYTQRSYDTPDMGDWMELLDFIDCLEINDILDADLPINRGRMSEKEQEFWMRIRWLRLDRK